MKFTLSEMPDTIEWLAIEGEPVRQLGHRRAVPELGIEASEIDTGERRPPADVLALLEPCEMCRGDGDDPGNRYRSPAFQQACDDCTEGRRKFDVETPCPTCNGTRKLHGPFGDRPYDHCSMFCNAPCVCGTGTIIRTFTVGEHGLVPVFGRTDPNVTHITFDPPDRWLLWTLDEHDEYDCDLITVHGVSERTTHALHVTEVTT